MTSMPLPVLVLVAGLGVALALLWLLVPFAVWNIRDMVREMLQLQREQARRAGDQSPP